MKRIIKSYKYRIKDGAIPKLNRMATSVNYVWNYCNEWSNKSILINSKFLSEFDLNTLTYGCSKELGIHSQTIQSVCSEYVVKRKKARRIRLKWRSTKRKLGWIPFTSACIKREGVGFKYYGLYFKVWDSHKLEGKIRGGNFSQDSRGRWYLNIRCEREVIERDRTGLSIGIDLGIKTTATCSDGVHINHAPNMLYEKKLSSAKRANKKRSIKTIYTKIKNSRKDFLQKESTKIVRRYDSIFVGDVSSKKLRKTSMAKSIYDNGWSMFKSMLEYKSQWLGIEYKCVNESFSTVTCSTCLNKTKQLNGLSTLGVREWTCEFCGSHHDRDVNAALNILRTGHCAPKGVSILNGEDANLRIQSTA